MCGAFDQFDDTTEASDGPNFPRAQVRHNSFAVGAAHRRMLISGAATRAAPPARRAWKVARYLAFILALHNNAGWERSDALQATRNSQNSMRR